MKYIFHSNHLLIYCILCRVDIDSLFIRIGEYNMAVEDEPLNYVERKVNTSVIHPKFLSSYGIDRGSDIGLLKLDKPIEFQANMMPICLPQDDDKFQEKLAWVTGWGTLGMIHNSMVTLYILQYH